MEKWDKKQIKRGASYLQSSLWAEFQRSMGNETYRLEAEGWTCLVISKTNRLGKFLFAPYGPILDSPRDLLPCLKELTLQAKAVGADWIKVEPMIINGDLSNLHKELLMAGTKRAARDLEPALTRILDITPSPEDLLAQISQSTRSVIRKNQRENILEFKTSSNSDDMKIFVPILDSVADRRGIGFFPQEYFVNQAKLLMPAGMLHLELAFDGKKPVGGAIMHDYGTVSSYTFAAALPEAQKKNVTALTLWQAILNAKSRGIKTIDLYGSAPDDAQPSHPWYGLSINKRKFGGKLVSFSGTWDLPLTKRYKLYRFVRSAWQQIRRS